jgi:Ca2+-binding RTX toxin-like protein
MAIKVRVDNFSSLVFSEITDLFGVLTTEADASGNSGSQLTLSGTFLGGSMTATVRGIGLTTLDIGGDTYVTGGTILEIDVTTVKGDVEFRDVFIDMATLAPIIESDINRSDPLAIENFFLSQNWDMNLGDGNDDAGRAQTVGEGAPLNLLGNDTLNGSRGRDVLFGGNGADFINGGEDNDKLYGGNGWDTISGGLGRDKLFGGKGRDTLIDEAGRDVFVGGAGLDTFIFSRGGNTNVIRDFDAQRRGEKIDLISVIGIEDMRDLRDNHLVQRGDDALIRSGDDDFRLFLRDTDVNDLDRGDFIFT